MAASVLLKRFEATFIVCMRDKYAQNIHSSEAAEERLMMKLHNLPGDRRVKLTGREAAALCEILLELNTHTSYTSDAEKALASEILDRIELPAGWDDPLDFAKVMAKSDKDGFEPVEIEERPQSIKHTPERDHRGIRGTKRGRYL